MDWTTNSFTEENFTAHVSQSSLQNITLFPFTTPESIITSSTDTKDGLFGTSTPVISGTLTPVISGTSTPVISGTLTPISGDNLHSNETDTNVTSQHLIGPSAKGLNKTVDNQNETMHGAIKCTGTTVYTMRSNTVNKSEITVNMINNIPHMTNLTSNNVSESKYLKKPFTTLQPSSYAKSYTTLFPSSNANGYFPPYHFVILTTLVIFIIAYV